MIVCFRATRSWPPIEQPPYRPDLRKYVIPVDEFIEGLVECEKATYGNKIFGSIHGYMGLEAKEPCEKNGGIFSYIVRHPLSRVHSAYIYYLYNFYYKINNLGIENKDIHERTCNILSKYDGLASDLEKYDYYSRENNLKNPLKEAIKQKLPDEIIDYYRKFKSRVNLHNMTNFKMMESVHPIPEEKNHLIQTFVKICKTFLFHDPILYNKCPASGIKMEEMVRSSEYFKNNLWPLIAPQISIKDSYLKSVFSSKSEKFSSNTPVSCQRFNVHRDRPLTCEEVWGSWPEPMKNYFRRCFEEFKLMPVCKSFDYDVHFI